MVLAKIIFCVVCLQVFVIDKKGMSNYVLPTRGFSADLLNSLIDETTAQLKDLEKQVQAAEQELRDTVSQATLGAGPFGFGQTGCGRFDLQGYPSSQHYEGYGALRLCHYFREQDIRRKDGGEITVGMVNRAVRNSIYIGVIHRGDSKSEVLPELKIIDEELFLRAQEIASTRPYFNILFDKPLHHKGCFIILAAQAVKHEYQQNIKFSLQGHLLYLLKGIVRLPGRKNRPHEQEKSGCA